MALANQPAPPVELLRRMRVPGAYDKNFVEILLVEDSPSDAELMVEALENGSLASRITVVDDGEEAMAYLQRQGVHESASAPDLIVLDLHLPRKSGHEVLSEIKRDQVLRLIPVVIMTSSPNQHDFDVAYDLHANCCVSKPSNLEEFETTVQKIEHFWLRVARRIQN